MKSKDRLRLRAAALMLGIADNEGDLLSDKQTLDDHDWSTYLLAKTMEPKSAEGHRFKGPAWVPYHLWSYLDWCDGELKDCVNALVYHANAKGLWDAIASTYDRPNDAAQMLPMELVRIQDKWRRLGALTPAKHQAHMLRLKANALAVAAEIDRIESLDALDTGEKFDFMRLYSETDKEIVYSNIKGHNMHLRNVVALEAQGKSLGYRAGTVDGPVSAHDWQSYNEPIDSEGEWPPNWPRPSVASTDARYTWELLTGNEEQWPGIVPTPSVMLKKLAAYFETEANRPPLKRPAHVNAERNYVCRYLGLYFRDSFGFASPVIISRIVSMFYAQGMTDNEVSQILAKLPCGNGPLPEPETSP